jgi:hypothetical protein
MKKRRLINLDLIDASNSAFLICFIYIPTSYDINSFRLWWIWGHKMTIRFKIDCVAWVYGRAWKKVEASS